MIMLLPIIRGDGKPTAREGLADQTQQIARHPEDGAK